MKTLPKMRQLGERSVLLDFEQEISEEVLQDVLLCKEIIQEKLLKDKVEVASTYSSLLITYHVAIEDVYSCLDSLKNAFSEANIRHNLKTRIFEVPVCYDEKFGLDLAGISAEKGVSKHKIIELHTAAEYRVYFTGFLPGFLYLGGLPEELYFSRRKEPRFEVQKGAVGIGEKQTGIYPQKSPGGWNIIGNSPVPLFDPYSDPPCPFSAGDRIRFYSISYEEHLEISEKIRKKEFNLKMKEDES